MATTSTNDDFEQKISVLVNGKPVQGNAFTSNAQADSESTTETEKESESKN